MDLMPTGGLVWWGACWLFQGSGIWSLPCQRYWVWVSHQPPAPHCDLLGCSWRSPREWLAQAFPSGALPTLRFCRRWGFAPGCEQLGVQVWERTGGERVQEQVQAGGKDREREGASAHGSERTLENQSFWLKKKIKYSLNYSHAAGTTIIYI